MTILKKTIILFLLASNVMFAESAIKSVDTGQTITKITTKSVGDKDYIFASSYDGNILLFDGDANKIWQKDLSGIVNHDLLIDDLDSDNVPEFYTVSADGSLSCFDINANLLWKFSKNEVPLITATSINVDSQKYIVVGGNDQNIYYINSKGDCVETIKSTSYSTEKTWDTLIHKGSKPNRHVANFLRTVKDEYGNDVLAVNAITHQMARSGSIYLMKPMTSLVIKKIEIPSQISAGNFSVGDYIQGQGSQMLMGSSQMVCHLSVMTPKSSDNKMFDLRKLDKGKIPGFGYRVTQGESIDQDGFKYFALTGCNIVLLPENPTSDNIKVLKNNYSYNDLVKDKKNNRMILASAQSGGSCIHIIDLNNSDWQNAYENLEPKGKIAKILDNSAKIRKDLESFKQPNYQREQTSVYFMSDSRRGAGGKYIAEIEKNYPSPIFLTSTFLGAGETWDRSNFGNPTYEKIRDHRRKYNITQADYLNHILPLYNQDSKGISYWGGHGNDPLMFSLDSQKKVIDGSKGKKTVMIFPELEDRSKDFEYVLDNYLYPLADYMQGKNAQLFVRTKHAFWLGTIHLPMWKNLLSGEYADVFIPAMEETSDKIMELSIAGRLGVWTSGATDSWGDRCARDNTSYNRMRQFSHQMLPNHFLRSMVYRISYGAQYLDNFTVNQEYMSLLWQLIAKGALYVPKRNQIVSFSPVHLSMLEPDEDFLEDANDIKWLNIYDEQKDNQPRVFNRLHSMWSGAKNTDWDFSTYAAGVLDRRLNFLPPYQYGMVMITPVDESTKYRKSLSENLNPIYKDILKQYFTDGRYYYKTAQKKDPIEPTKYYKEIQQDIKDSSKNLPINVEGENVAWVAVQVSDKHYRLTLIDGGYINPNDRVAIVKFNTIKPKKILDILSKEEFKLKKAHIEVNIPCGAFRFIDIEI